MAGNTNIKGINVSIGGDTVDLQKALVNVNSSSRTLQSELTQINKQLKFDPQNTVLLSQKQKVLAESIETTKAKLNQLMSVQDQVEKQAASGEIGQDKYRAFQREVESTKGKLKNLESQLEDTKNATAEFETKGNKLDLSEFQKEVDDVKSAVSDLKDTAKDTFKEIGAGVAAGGAAAIGAIKSYDSVESALHSIQAQTGASDEQMQSYRDTLETLYESNYGESLEEVANVISLVTQFTNETDPSKIQDITKNAFTLRDTFDYDFAESLRAVQMLMNQFGISAEQAYNLIVQGSQKGLNKNGDLLDTINEYSVHYRQLGYTAEGFFNSLENGTEAGTFSVDKLGDAMKEFGIRVKDTATTTTEGFTLLGYGASGSEEAISKVKDEIAKLEKNLQYAKMEQDNFNDSTSELTKLKNADKIEEYSSQLENAKKRLKSLTSETGSSLGSIEELQAKFAEGGEAAQEATQDVLTALFEMDDKVKQNQAGVDLFGTMWEDLGVDGVKALMDVSGSADSTVESMKEINDIKYDDVTNRISSLGRKIQTEIINKLVEKYYPKIKDGIDWVSENLDVVEKALKGIGLTIAGVFVAKTIMGFVNAIKTTITVVKTLKAAMTALELSQAGTPWGLVALGVGTVVSGVSALITYYQNAQVETVKFTEEQQNLINKTNELADSWKKIKEERDKAVEETNSEYGYYTELKNELDQIVTKNGEIKKGYEERAKTIANTLSEALGIDVEMTGNTLKNYQEISKELDTIINKKKAEAMVSVYGESYQEALKNRNSALETLEGYENDLNDLYPEYKKAYDKVQKIQEELNAAEIAYGEGSREVTDLKRNLAEAKSDDILAKYDEKNIKFKNQQNIYNGYLATLTNYQKAQAALQSGNEQEISQSIARLTSNFQTAEYATRETLENQVANAKSNFEELRKAYQDGSKGVTLDMVADAQYLVGIAEMELAKLPKDSSEIGAEATVEFGKGMVSNTDKLIEKSKEPAIGAKKGMESVDFTSVGPAKIKETASGVYSSKGTLKKAVKDAAEYGKTGAENVSFLSVGWNFIQGLVNGISNGWENLKNGVKNVASNIVNGIKDFLGIHSPSTVAEKEIGYNFDLGIEKGLDKGKGRIKKKSQQLAGTIADTFKKDLKNKSKEIEKSGIDLSAGYNLRISDIDKEKINAAQSKIRSVIDTLNNQQSNIKFSNISANINRLKQPASFNNSVNKIINNSPVINVTVNAHTDINNNNDFKKLASEVSCELAKEIQRENLIWG